MKLAQDSIKLTGVKVEDAEDGVRWRELIRCSNPQGEQPKK